MACCSRSRLRSYSHSSSTRQPLPPAPFRQRIDRPLPLLYVTSVYPRVYVRVCVRECVYRKVVAAPIDTYCYWYSSCGSALLHATLDRRSRPEIRSVKLRIDWFSLFVGFFFHCWYWVTDYGGARVSSLFRLFDHTRGDRAGVKNTGNWRRASTLLHFDWPQSDA